MIKFNKTWKSAILLLVFLLSFTALILAADKEVHITILGTTDVHGNIMNYDYYGVHTYSQGFAMVNTMVKRIKSENPNTILIDAGDLIQGTPLTYYYGKKMKPDKNYPMTKIMNLMGYSAGAVGNHEFNYGQDTLHKIIDTADFPVLSANIIKESDSSLEFTPYTIIDVKGVKVAILGLTTQATTASEIEGLRILNPLDVAKEYVKKLKEEEKVDLVFISAHFGLDPEEREGNYARPIAQEVPGVDGILTGHDHAFVDIEEMGPGGYTVPILMPYKWGRALARYDFYLKRDNAKWVIDRDKTEHQVYDLRKMELEPDQEILLAGQSYHQETLEYTGTVIGTATADFKKGYQDEIKGISQGKLQDTPLVNLVNAVQMKYAEADISLAAEFAATANIKKGDITINDLSSIYIYENYLYGIKITGSELKKLLEFEARYYRQVKDGDATIAFNDSIPGYNYDMFKGITFDIDLSKPAPESAADLEDGKQFRIYNLKKDGKLVKDNDKFILALNDYRFQSWGKKMHGGFLYAMGIKSKEEAMKRVVFSSQEKYGDEGQVRNLMISYVKGKGTISPLVDDNWHLTGFDFSDLVGRDEMVQLINEGIISVPTKGRFGVNYQAINLYEKPEKEEISLISEKTNIPVKLLEKFQTKGELYKNVVILRDNYKKVSILSINDFHGALAQGGSNIGSSRLAGAIKSEKVKNPDGTIIVSAGDNYQGSAMSNLLYGEPVSAAFREMGIEASAVGNHEFDWGDDRINRWGEEGGFPFVAANIYDKRTGEPVSWAKPYVFIERKGAVIAFIGIATPETAYKTLKANVENYEFRDPVETLKTWVPILQMAGSDAMVALTHCGAFQDKDGSITGEAVDLTYVKGVDAVISAHTHQKVSGYVNGKPLVQAYKYGRTLGKLEFIFDQNDRLISAKPSIDNLYKRQDELKDDPETLRIYNKYNNEMKPVLERVIGKTTVNLRHDRYEGPSLLGEWATEVMKEKASVQIAMTNGGGLRTSIPAGEITVGKMYEVMPFDNTLFTMKLSGADIRANIEHGILNEDIGWIQVSGVKVVYNPDEETGNRIISITLEDGTPLEMDKYYTVVTNDFMATGGDDYKFENARKAVNTFIPLRETLIEAVEKSGTLSPVKKNWIIELKKITLLTHLKIAG
ncbi:2',3'-cyclic-nucleotide 2'-phosphodiesterase [Iocasia frigidifontis]|uniref:2',3'-cyclic-nucleotide 2'-phosphodiesterase n=1 Tax=Iocasia fonsfrigidae TaxID=2682810 RepID=A0A8A7K4I6_9FIRM|nr:5'-nucleotidase C-terminal domain-containing protein [Iocasia fonsfrigidae]QTL96606.1 2',3'-cyclic-nucleotide 2'-phosphodiesterase [Iocasia fonsfrigidae]